MSSLRGFRLSDGKRLRTPEEFIRDQGDDPVSKVLLYNKKDHLVLEAWKNMKTKRTHILKIRRPTNVEEKEFGSMIFREQMLHNKDNQDQVEVIVGGADYVKEIKSSNK